jgi:hypothetical protein
VVERGAGVPVDSSLRNSPKLSVGLVLPAALSERLDCLVALAEKQGERTNRREVVAALLLAAAPSGAVVSELIREFRRAQVRDALVGDPSDEVFKVERRKPGPRPRSDGGR